MDIYFGLFWVTIVMMAPTCTSLPTKGESMTTAIHSIINMAQTTLVRISTLRTTLPVSPLINMSSPFITGLSSISLELELLEAKLRRAASEPLSQIHADVSSLDGWVWFLAETTGCPIRTRSKVEATEDAFPESHFYPSLTKVQLYLEKLLRCKDRLKIC